jgi:hypothetical protein
MEKETMQPIALRTHNVHTKHIPANFFANTVAHPTMGKLMEYQQLITDLATRAA